MAATAYAAPTQSSIGGMHWESPNPARKVKGASPEMVNTYTVLIEQQTSAPYKTTHKNRSRSRSNPQPRRSRNFETYDNGYDSRRSSTDLSDAYANDKERGNETGWIHRDKLAQIENQEMQEAGMRVHKLSNKNLRARNIAEAHARSISNESNQYSGETTPAREYYPSSPPIDTTGLVETNGFGYEDADEMVAPADQQQSISRGNVSRIPLSKNSPVPVSTSFTERESPLNRSRNGSLALSTSPEMPQPLQFGQRPRSQSAGSQMLLDSAGGKPRSRPVSAHQASPLVNSSSSSPSVGSSKSQTKKPGTLNVAKAGTRKTSVNKDRIASDGSVKNSPSPTASKPRSRPLSINRPEGDAPWIATMYKPDPMLPQDQQILPTHAKKMMQEQWAREGKTGDTYDKDFNLLNSNDPAGGKVPPTAAPKATEPVAKPTEEPIAAADVVTPLKAPPPKTAPSRPVSAAPSRSGSLSGGYRITPVVDPNQVANMRRESIIPTDDNPERSMSVSQIALLRHRQSLYRLQTVGKLPREEQVRDGIGTPKIVHHLDIEKVNRLRRNAAADEEEGGCLKCSVM